MLYGRLRHGNGHSPVFQVRHGRGCTVPQMARPNCGTTEKKDYGSVPAPSRRDMLLNPANMAYKKIVGRRQSVCNCPSPDSVIESPQASVSLTVVTFQYFLDVTLTVECLAPKQEIWQYPFMTVLLQGTPAHVQPLHQFPVGEVTLATQRRDITVGDPVCHFQASPYGLHGIRHHSAILCQYLITHLTTDSVALPEITRTSMPFPASVRAAVHLPAYNRTCVRFVKRQCRACRVLPAMSSG